MEFIKTKLEGAWLIRPEIFKDNRGFFLESYSQKKFREAGIETVFVQDNHSKSVQKGVLRGLHFQNPPYTQTKLVRVTKGAVYDVIVDIRKDSKTFGQWEGFELTEENFLMLYVPRGFLHGFCTIKENTEFQYKCDSFYEPSSEGGVIWNDPTLNISWPVNNPVLSERDKKWGTLKDLNSPF